MKDKMQGKAEEAEGKVEGDHVREAEGKGRQAVGEVKEGAHELKNKVENAVDGGHRE